MTVILRQLVGAVLILAASCAPAEAHHVREGNVRFKVTCDHDRTALADPIAPPTHEHEFFGARLDGGTTCNDGADLAGYWQPALFEGRDRVQPGRMTAYYRLGGKHAPIEPYPEGLKVVSSRGGWECNGGGITAVASDVPGDQSASGGTAFARSTSEASTIPQLPIARPDLTSCDGTLKGHVRFPDCWDGVNLDSADHRSHLAFAVPGTGANTCPSSHPVPLPALTTYTNYTVGGGDLSLSSGLLSTWHGDFLNAWEPGRLAELVDDCLNAGQRCGSGSDL